MKLPANQSGLFRNINFSLVNSVMSALKQCQVNANQMAMPTLRFL